VVLVGGAMAGAEIGGIVGVDAVGDGGETAVHGDAVQRGEEFVLAVVAAVGSIGAVGGIFQLVRFDEFVAQAGGLQGLFPVARGRKRNSSRKGRSRSGRVRPALDARPRRDRRNPRRRKSATIREGRLASLEKRNCSFSLARASKALRMDMHQGLHRTDEYMRQRPCTAAFWLVMPRCWCGWARGKLQVILKSRSTSTVDFAGSVCSQWPHGVVVQAADP